MKLLNKILITLLLLIAISYSLKADEDFSITKKYHNVIVRMTIPYCNEELYKAIIAGTYAEKLCERLGYKDTVLLDYYVNYIDTHSNKSVYYISIDGECIRYKYPDEGFNYEPDNDNERLIIRQGVQSVDPRTTLKLLEYSIKNVKLISHEQKLFESLSLGFFTYSIDTNRITDIVRSNPGEDIRQVLKEKVKRIKTEDICSKVEDYDDNGIFYFYQDSSYHINFYNIFTGKDSTALILPDIDIFKNLNHEYAIVFDTGNSFYFLENWNNKRVSKRHIIERDTTRSGSINDNLMDYVSLIGGNKLSIYFSKKFYGLKSNGKPLKFGYLYRHLLYYIDIDLLIQDVDRALGINDELEK